MDARREIREFLTTRRARLSPEQAGLPVIGGNRRVPGLRREEAAALAGVSIDYYTRLERGVARGVSDSVLEALSRALQLDDAERTHLLELVRASSTLVRPRRRSAPKAVRPSVQRVLDGMVGTPAFVVNGRLDLIGANPLARALYADLQVRPGVWENMARYAFLDERAPAFYPDWEELADQTVALLRAAAGHDPFDRDLTDLVGELSTRSAPFRERWAAHDVRRHRTGVKRFHHPAVGDLALTYEAMELAADQGLTLTVYSAEPGTPSDDGLRLLASWIATQQDEAQAVDRF